MNILEISATVFVLLSVVLAMFPRRLCNHVSIIGQIFWIIYGLNNNLNFLAFQSFIILLTNLYALKSWKEKGIPLI
jgi:hypothetical protein